MGIVSFAYQNGRRKKSLLTRLAPFSRNFLYVFSCLLHKMSHFDPSFFELTPPELSLIAQNDSENILPEKSKSRYISTYDEFIAWREEKKANSFSENVMLAYFSELSAKLKPSTLWSRFSMIKSMLKIRNNVDIIFISKRHCVTNLHEQSYEINNSLSQTVNMQPKTSPVSIKNCSNFNVYVNYNFY
ncbi:hypothetical protein ABMA28_013120 [Loxostege sticticalis]|uniref:Uncharacterized protein n=1 Tax=Loxostege sticticalis TaxID=481309 RepID=A0ABD0S3V3_LOXSC